MQGHTLVYISFLFFLLIVYVCHRGWNYTSTWYPTVRNAMAPTTMAVAIVKQWALKTLLQSASNPTTERGRESKLSYLALCVLKRLNYETVVNTFLRFEWISNWRHSSWFYFADRIQDLLVWLRLELFCLIFQTFIIISFSSAVYLAKPLRWLQARPQGDGKWLSYIFYFIF